MRRYLARALREPLLHFLVIGAAIFAVYGLVDRPAATPKADRIVISQGTINTIVETFRLKRLRNPTPAELNGLVADHVKEEIYYREAIRMGLDRNDTVVRRRLRQKLEFLLQDRLSNLAPTDAELAAYLARHADRYRTQDRVSFVQVYLSRSRRGDRIEADARRILAELRSAEEPVDVDRHSDSRLLPTRFENADRSEVDRVFGPKFFDRLESLPSGQWSGPVVSGYGLHLVRVAARRKGAAPDLAAVRAAVTRDWLEEQRQAAATAFYEALRARYTVTIETGDAPAPSKPGGKPSK